MTSSHWLPPILFLAAAFLGAGFRLLPTRPSSASAPKLSCPEPQVRREHGLLQIRCPAVARPAPIPAAARLLLGLRLDLNTATEEELQALPRIGPVLARRILEARGASGGFCAVEELGRVRGIGPATLARLAPLVSADGCAGAGRR